MTHTVVISGASGGIGGAIAQRFAADGSHVINVDRRLSETIQSVITDVSMTADITRAFSEIDRLLAGGVPDLFVGCAAVSKPAHVLDVTPDDFDLMTSVNMRGLFFCAQAAARRMQRKGRGSIILISSVAAEQAWASESIYCATKAATRALVQAMAVELAPFGIRVNAVGPGPIDHKANDMAATRQDPEVYRHEIERTPLHRFGTPQEVAEAVVLLDNAHWVTGQTLYVDGGFLATGLGFFGAARENLMMTKAI